MIQTHPPYPSPLTLKFTTSHIIHPTHVFCHTLCFSMLYHVQVLIVTLSFQRRLLVSLRYKACFCYLFCRFVLRIPTYLGACLLTELERTGLAVLLIYSHQENLDFEPACVNILSKSRIMLYPSLKCGIIPATRLNRVL